MKTKLKIILNLSAFAIVIFTTTITNAQTTGVWSGTTTPTTTTSAVGIGTTSPAGQTEIFYGCGIKGMVITRDLCAYPPPPLEKAFEIREVSGPGPYSTKLVFTGDYKLGIGTGTPQGKLHIDGADALFIERRNGYLNTKFKIGISQNGGPNGLRFLTSNDGGATFSDVLHLADNGNVGIGTVLPNAKLVVAGMICANEIRVSLNGDPCIFPDYVFEDDYKLMPLGELKEYITLNKHLPEIQTAYDFAQNGIEMGDFQVKMLRKIEELTLYTIQMDEENKILKKKLSEIEAKLQTINKH